MAFPEALLSHLQAAKRVVVLTGAGASAESGVPTFRDAQTGLWSRFRPEDLATPEAFIQNPQIVWEWYNWRKKLIAEVQPNPGHYALAEIEARLKSVPGKPSKFTLITQNVDGLHQRVGSLSVLELHGNLQRYKCFSEGIVIEHLDLPDAFPPRCPNCGRWLRPDVVWFGELLPAEEVHQAMWAAQNCDIFLSVGTSAIVQPAASLPLIALEKGAVVIEINTQETTLTHRATFSLRGPSGILLPALVRAVWI